MANIYNFQDGQHGRETMTSKCRNINGSNVLIIDNGSYVCRAGFASIDEPVLVFKNLAFRQKGRNNEPDSVAVGRDIENLETVRTQLRSPFDRNVVTQFDTQETIYDYVFSKLDVQSQECVQHPILMTEPTANPNYCRKFMSELMFECYCVPSLTYYTDALSSWYACQPQPTTSLESGVVVSIGYQTMHIVPVINGVVDQENIRRVNIGGYHLDYFMQKLLQLKYPIHSSAISLSRSEEIVHNHTWVAADYKAACDQWTSIPYYERQVIQYTITLSLFSMNS